MSGLVVSANTRSWCLITSAGVAGAGPGEQSPHRYRLGYVQVNGGVQYQVQPSADVGGRDGLRQGPGKSVQDVLAAAATTGVSRSPRRW